MSNVLLLLSFLFTPEQLAWHNAGFTNPEISEVRLLSEASVPVTHWFEATFVVFRETRWQAEAVLKRARRSAEIYRQCGIEFRAVKLVVSDAPWCFIDVGWTSLRDRKIAEATPATASRPYVYFIRNDLDGYYAYAWRKGLAPHAALRDTTWISRPIEEDLDFNSSVDPSYEPLAHELGHLIGDSGHTDDTEKNLMGEQTEYLNDSLTTEQCLRFKKSDLVRPINRG